MIELRRLPDQESRVETGPVQFGDDWPGTFVRGDNSAFYAGVLAGVILRLKAGKSPDPFALGILENMAALFATSTNSPLGDELRQRGADLATYEYHSAGYLLEGVRGMSFAPAKEFVEAAIAETAKHAGDDPEDYTATEVFIRGTRGYVVTPASDLVAGPMIGTSDIKLIRKQ